MPYARVLYSSLRAQQTGAKFHTLIVADRKGTASVEDFITNYVEELLDTDTAKGIYRKYSATNSDRFRWALKPVYMSWLLRQGYTKVIFLDPDLFFTGDPAFLLDELDTASVILTPHWSNPNPLEYEDGIFAIMKNGMYNAGFIGASAKGLPAIEWWAEMCHYRIEKAFDLGIYDDQKYLDLLPVEYDDVKIIKHRGCNLAYWNMDTNRREIKNGKLQIRGGFEPIFIHFAKGTIDNIRNGNDEHLTPYLKSYLEALKQAGLKETIRLEKESIFYYIKRKTLIRTRFKRFLFFIASKL